MATGFGSRTIAALKVQLASAVAGFAGTSAATLSSALAGVTVGLTDAVALPALSARPLALDRLSNVMLRSAKASKSLSSERVVHDPLEVS
uniref:Putative secreted protein n=1 Tax=Ixodes ricinus TaxID=34613 RepID=A0A6B0UAI1_IXORI